MATTARALFSAHVDGLQVESIPFQFPWTLPTAVLKRETLAWGPGDATLTVPTGTTLIVVNPPATTIATLIVKGAGADTGWRISSQVPTVLSIAGSQAWLIGASLAVTGIELTYL
jgi:hypothetical protein